MSFRWTRPSQVNGVLEFYSIFLSRDGAEPVLAYNSSDLFEDHTLRNLTPGSIYTVAVSVSSGSSRVPTFTPLFIPTHMYKIMDHCVCPSQACTGGGCTLSPPSQAQTEESTPESVPAPLVTPLSPHALNVSWTPPRTPNGERSKLGTDTQTQTDCDPVRVSTLTFSPG